MTDEYNLNPQTPISASRQENPSSAIVLYTSVRMSSNVTLERSTTCMHACGDLQGRCWLLMLEVCG